MHRRRGRVVRAHRRKTEDELDRPQDARGRIEGVVDDGALRERARDEQHRAVRVHVIGPGLRIVFDGEDRGLLPIDAVRNGFDQAAERDVVFRDHRARRRRARLRARRVIVRQPDDRELRQLAVALELAELLQPDVDALVVRDLEIPPRVRRRHESGEARHRLDRDDVVVRAWARIDVIDELAVAAQADVGAPRVIPDVAARRRRDVAERIAQQAAAFGEVR